MGINQKNQNKRCKIQQLSIKIEIASKITSQMGEVLKKFY